MATLGLVESIVMMLVGSGALVLGGIGVGLVLRRVRRQNTLH
jgi:hypothetical protein